VIVDFVAGFTLCCAALSSQYISKNSSLFFASALLRNISFLYYRYDHTSKVDDLLRSQGFAGFPVVRSAEICFVRQIQLMMFSIYEERLNLEISRIGLEEVCSNALICICILFFARRFCHNLSITSAAHTPCCRF
jgi:hypothetical protein